MEQELKPCPFCGSPAEIPEKVYGVWAVRCASMKAQSGGAFEGHAQCRVYGPERRSKKLAIASWNTRVTP